MLGLAKRPFDGRFEILQLDGLDEMLGKACLQTSFDIAVVPETTNRNSRNIGDRAQLHYKIRAASVRKSNVADEQIEFVAHGSFHGRAHVVRHGDQMPAAREQFLERSAGILMIV